MALFGIFGKGKKKGRGVDLSRSSKPLTANEETSKLAKAAAVRLEAARANPPGAGQGGDSKTKFWRRQIPLGQLLMRKGLISDKQLEEALSVQKERRKESPTGAITESYLGRILIDLNFIEEAELAKFLSVYWQIPFVELANVTIRRDVVTLLSADIARKYCVFPLHKVGRTVVLAMFNPTAQGLMEYISKKIGFQIKPAIGTRSDILHFIDKFYPEGGAAPTSDKKTDEMPVPKKAAAASTAADTSVKFVPEAKAPAAPGTAVPVAKPVDEAAETKPMPAAAPQKGIEDVEDVEEIEEIEEEIPLAVDMPLPSETKKTPPPPAEKPAPAKPVPVKPAPLVAKKPLPIAEEKPPIPVAEPEKPAPAAKPASKPAAAAKPAAEPAAAAKPAVKPAAAAKPAVKPAAAAAKPAAEAAPVAAIRITEEEFEAAVGMTIDDRMARWIEEHSPGEKSVKEVAEELFSLSTGARI